MFDIPANVIEDALNKAIDVIIQKHEELGQKATGDWERGLEARVSHNSGSIWGLPYTEQLVFGRAPGKRPPISPLVKWAQAKFGYSGQQAVGVAHAVANKIAKEGTTWYQQGGSDLLEVLDDQRVVDTFYSEIGSYLTIRVADELRRTLEELAA